MTTPLRSLAIFGLSLTAALFASFAAAQAPDYPPAGVPQEAGEPPPVPGDDDITVQPRGPVHEAFALPPNTTPRPGPIVAKKPPDPIPEVPPEQKPQDDNVQWIPGYWAWNAEREDYIWISGMWRVPPAGRKWVPGAWNAVEGGYQWSPGFWAPAGQEEMPYLPPPPDSLDNGPSSPPPDDDSFYVPGCWLYQSTRYVWQPGYWQAYRPGMIWTPSAYSWTPGGCLFVPGYWDWPLDGRGLLFAPVAFNRPLWNTPGWSYQPNFCVPYNGLLSSLFLSPAGSGFYFGNYSGPAYRRLGFRPWFATSGAYNPLFSWYRWRNRNNPGWLDGLRATNRGRTFNSSHLIQPLRQFNAGRLARLNTAQINEFRARGQRFQQFSTQRQSLQRQALRETRAPLPLARLPHPPAVSGAPVVHPARAVAPGSSPPRILTAHHTEHSNVSHHNPAPAAHHAPPAPAHHAPPTPAHHAPPPAPKSAPAAHHAAAPVPKPAPVAHHAAAPTPAHHAPPAPAHHAPPAPKPAPAAHKPAPPSHGGGGNHGGGGHGGHHR